jgi:hypothetical protein
MIHVSLKTVHLALSQHGGVDLIIVGGAQIEFSVCVRCIALGKNSTTYTALSSCTFIFLSFSHYTEPVSTRSSRNIDEPLPVGWIQHPVRIRYALSHSLDVLSHSHHVDTND